MGKFNRGDKPGGFGGRRSDRSTMYQATCGECGSDCEVPFKPTGDRPVLCDNCFSKKRGDRPNRSGGRDFSHNKTMHTAICNNCGAKCEVPFRPTGGKPVYCSTCFDQMGGSDRNKGGSRSNEQLNEKFAALNTKLDKILEALTRMPEVKAKTIAKSEKVTASKKTDKKPTKKIIKKTVTKKKK